MMWLVMGLMGVVVRGDGYYHGVDDVRGDWGCEAATAIHTPESTSSLLSQNKTNKTQNTNKHTITTTAIITRRSRASTTTSASACCS